MLICFTSSIDVVHPETRVILIGAGELCTMQYIREVQREIGLDNIPGTLSFVSE